MSTRPETTLLELVTTINQLTEDENELLATVTHLINSRQVVLRGIFARQLIPTTTQA